MFEDATYDELRAIVLLLENGAGDTVTTKYLWEWVFEKREIYRMHKNTPGGWFVAILENEPAQFPKMT